VTTAEGGHEGEEGATLLMEGLRSQKVPGRDTPPRRRRTRTWWWGMWERRDWPSQPYPLEQGPASYCDITEQQPAQPPAPELGEALLAIATVFAR